MHSNPLFTEQRAARMLRERITPAVYSDYHPLTLTAWDAPGEPVSFTEAVSQTFTSITVGTTWGAPWRTTWIHATGSVPAGWREREGQALELVADLGFTTTQPGFQTEGLLQRADGTIIKAISPRSQAVSWASESDTIDVYIEAAANPDVAQDFSFAPTPYGDLATCGDELLYTLGRIDITLRDLTVWELVQDLTILLELAADLPLTSTRRARIDTALDRAVDRINPADIAASAAAARAELADVLACPAHASAHHLIAVGHAHIDSAWLWPTRETVRKCVRTFASALALMEEDPDYIFAASSAQQYFWVKAAQPELFEKIRSRVAEGRFVPVGGMWLESDTNMPGGEALARQMIEGKLFFLDEFGLETHDVWLPDSFGYSGALPQIVRAAGSQWFLSQKLSWNDTDAMPHHTFEWEGIDGSRVLTHFPPVDMYNSRLAISELRHAEDNFAEKAVSTTSIVPYGWGDGGGGPTRDMLAAAHRCANLEGVPTVELGSPTTFFERAQTELTHPPTWRGEMYLEFHRGTYTSQARTKQSNRRSEHLLREAELWAATATVRTGAPYPTEILKESWRTVLRNQFHDILPGTSIAWVYQQTEAEYAQVERDLTAVITTASAALLGTGKTPFLLNAAPHARAGVVALGAAPMQAPALSTRPVVVEEEAGAVLISNGLIRMRLDECGLITSLVDLTGEGLGEDNAHDGSRECWHSSEKGKGGREVIPEGDVAGLLQLHRDAPRQWDAWDIDAEYRNVYEDVTEIEHRTVTSQEGAVVVRVDRKLGEASRVRQEIRVCPGSPAVEITFDIDWHERQKLLKVTFPLDVMAETSAAETQFGHVRRPTHQNTTWDAARYEICAHRWVHVGEEGYGVSIANDSTYGHDITRTQDTWGHPTTTVRLSLLRAPLFPDPQADQGQHRMRVSLRPGSTIADAVREGYRLNLTPRVVLGDHGFEPLVRVHGTGVVVEAVKLAEDGSGDVIVRLYESLGARTRARVVPGFTASQLTRVDLLERPLAHEGGPGEDGSLITQDGTLTLRPFQLATVRVARE